MSRAAATDKLKATIEPRSSAPVQVQAGGSTARSTRRPPASGRLPAHPGRRQARQPLNPITRVSSFFTQREVPVVDSADDRAVRTRAGADGPAGAAGSRRDSVEFQDLNQVHWHRSPARRSTSTRPSASCHL
ncbi:hypothetical protein HBB16_16965 [Pseudonocardia sp. MCCB 268]|nr:hypothetical protein [Pseudonocardia cytotoxica]